MLRLDVTRHCVALGLLALLGGCGGGMTLDPGEWFSSSGSSAKSDTGLGFTVFKGAAEAPVRAITPADLVNADGSCAAAVAEGAAPPRVALTMTECEMVAANGAPEQVNVGTGEGGQRRVVLTYTKGEHPGTYTFVGGRLKVMEELPGPVKPQPKKRAPRKPASSRPATTSVR
jgi:hypothetical protein